MKKIYSILALSLALFALNSTVNAQDEETIASWDFTAATGSENTVDYGTNNLAATTANANLTVGGLTRSEVLETNITDETSTLNIWGSRDFNTTNTTTLDANDFEARAAEAISEGKYITFTITPKDEKTISITGVDEYRARASGSIRMRWQYQVGSGEFKTIDVRNLGTDVLDYSLGTSSSGTVCTAFSLADSLDLQNISETVTFRVIIYQGGQRSNLYAAGFFNSNLNIKGIVKSIDTGINENEADNANIIIQDQSIRIQSVNASSVSLYTISGRLVSNKVVDNGNVNFDVNEKGVYLIKIGNKTSKVVL